MGLPTFGVFDLGTSGKDPSIEGNITSRCWVDPPAKRRGYGDVKLIKGKLVSLLLSHVCTSVAVGSPSKLDS
jgi:hypothetical protein